MDKDNIVTVRNVCILLVSLLSVLIVFYSLFDNNAVRNIICIGSAISVSVLCTFTIIMMKSPRLCTPFNTDLIINILSTLCFGVGIYLGTFAAPNDLAVAPVWMFFFAVLIFNRLPVQNIVVLTLSGIAFVICSYDVKMPHHFQYDVIHALTSIIASGCMSWGKSRMKILNILSVQQLENDNIQIKETVEKKEKQTQALKIQAEIDGLTGFYKKEVFEKNVISILSDSTNNQTHAFICSDIDNFKNINDYFGHMFGDNVLKEISAEISHSINGNCTFGRFGGDEFIIFVADVANVNEIEEQIKQLEYQCDRAYCQNEVCQKISLSVGTSFYPNDGKDYISLFEKADSELYIKKRKIKAYKYANI